ncbi:MAG: hypothetical protein LBQ50_12975 [Planctomycetaceae bacterium]|nr:hypothetical protein [Planctomycetaceae bacterium]
MGNFKSMSGILRMLCKDELMFQNLNDFIRSHSNLHLAISELNFALERSFDESYWKQPQQDVLKREGEFIQSFSQHFTGF